MKLFLVTLFLLSSMTSFAGDLSLNCFYNQDRGDYAVENVTFMDNNTASRTVETSDEQIIVLVKRSDLFENYVYTEIHIKKSDASYTTKITPIKNYDDWVYIGQGITCQVTD